MEGLIKLSENTLGIIQKFISSKDFIQLYLTSKSIFKETKRLKFIVLKRVDSFKFYKDYEFRERVLSYIDSRYQLSLDLNNYWEVVVVRKLWGIHTLNLSGCDNVSDVNFLGDIHTLNLGYCANVSDVSALGGVYSLKLSGCFKVTDVSALGGVHTLNLKNCYNVNDVSALGGVHTLNLSNSNVSVVSDLGGVHTLNLKY